MREENKKLLDEIAYKYTNLAHFTNEELIRDRLEKLYKLDEDDVIDRVLITIYDFISRGLIDKDVALEHIEDICELNKEKYKNTEDLIKRVNFLKSMNLMNTSMPLKENHKLVLEVFDAFNELIGTSLDAYYTGGMMGYLAMGKELVRYHSDLDVLINEDELEKLKKMVDESEDFEFVSCLKDKGPTGHEFVVRYKGTPMCIGLFLFNRTKDGMVRNSYYYKGDKLLVDREYLSKDYVDLTYVDRELEHNDVAYKMVSLESVYQAKRNSRPKDQYDARVIKDAVDMSVVERIEAASEETRRVDGLDASNTLVARIEDKRKR